MLVFDDLHLDDDVDLTPDAMEGVEDGEPSIQRVLRATVCQGVETDVDLANDVVSSVCVIVHQPVGDREWTVIRLDDCDERQVLSTHTHTHTHCYKTNPLRVNNNSLFSSYDYVLYL